VSRPAAATIGVFDGVHRGHRSLFDRTIALAREIGGESVAFTFEPHPAAVLAPERLPCRLVGPGEKVEQILAAGIERVEVLPFDRAMSQLLPEEFVDGTLRTRAALSHLVVGHDFAFGRGRVGTASRLMELGSARGIRVERLPAVTDGGEVISSSRIRRALAAGEMELAERLLGRPWSFRGVVEPGDGRGRTLGFPTANLAVASDRCRPLDGVYAVRVLIPADGGSTVHPGVMNLGVRPTFEGSERRFEVHLFDFERDLVGATLEVTPKERLRGEVRFSGPDELRVQIAEDVRRARELFGLKRD
jgi:riboflavin kinase/FMN adenylyltransferase